MGSCLPAPTTGNEDAFASCSSAAAVAVLWEYAPNRACMSASQACMQGLAIRQLVQAMWQRWRHESAILLGLLLASTSAVIDHPRASVVIG